MNKPIVFNLRLDNGYYPFIKMLDNGILTEIADVACSSLKTAINLTMGEDGRKLNQSGGISHLTIKEVIIDYVLGDVVDYFNDNELIVIDDYDRMVEWIELIKRYAVESYNSSAFEVVDDNVVYNYVMERVISLVHEILDITWDYIDGDYGHILKDITISIINIEMMAISVNLYI